MVDEKGRSPRPQDNTGDADRMAIAWDWEAYYSTKEPKWSLKDLPTWKYCSGERSEPYLLSMCGFDIFDEGLLSGKEKTFDEKGSMFQRLEDGRQVYVGRPENFPCYEKARGRLLLAHNASYDCPQTLAAIDRGLVPQFIRENRWACTADLTAYLGVRRNLKDAMKYLFGKEISKDVRTFMDGKHDYELSPSEYRDLIEYGGNDAVECHDIWLRYASEWPEVERRLSEINREATIRGIRLDVDYLKESIKGLEAYERKVSLDVPWTSEINPKTGEFYKLGSLPALKRAVENLGLVPPPTFKKDSPVFLQWLADHDDIPFIAARQKAVAASVHLARLRGMLETMDPDGRSHPPFLYFGAHSGRFSAKSDAGKSSGNLLNLPRKPLFKGVPDINGGEGIDVRGMYIADPGCTFVIADWSQVEPRITMWLAGDLDKFELIKKEGNLYQMNAVEMRWCESGCDLKHTNDPLYKTAKAVSIGATYGLGYVKFVDYCKGMGFDLESLPPEKWPEIGRRENFILRTAARIKGDFRDPKNVHKVGQVFRAMQVIDDWRRANPKIADRQTGLWAQYERVFKSRVAAGKSTVAYRLPNGFVKRYFDPHLAKKPTVEIDEDGREVQTTRIEMRATTVRGEEPDYISPGKITENLVQCFGRMLLANVIVEMQEEHPEWPYILSVYDEVVIQCPEKDAEYALSELSRVMCRGKRISEFTQGLPLEVEGCISKCYTK